MSTQDPQPDKNNSISAFWRRFHLWPSRFDRFGFKHWYLIVFGPYLLLLIQAVIIDILAKDLWRLTKVDLTDWIFISVLATLALTAWLFNGWQCKIPETFQGLLDMGRISSSSEHGDVELEYRSFLEEYQRTLFSNWRYLLPGIFMILVLGFARMSGMLTDIPQLLKGEGIPLGIVDSGRIATRWLLAPLFWAYFVGVGVWSVGVTGWYVRNLTRRFTLNVQPSHPDRCGGLKPLGDLCLGIAFPILVGAALLGIYGIGGAVFPGSFRSVIVVYANVALIVLALPLALIAFFAPLWDIHRDMVNKRKRYENEFADRLAKAEEKIRTHLDQGELEEAKAAKTELEIVRELHPDKIGYPVWPFDRSIVLKFLTPQIIPIVGLIVRLSDPVAEALRSVLTILFG